LLKLKFSLILCCAILSMFVCGCSNSISKTNSTDLPQTVLTDTPISTEVPTQTPAEIATEKSTQILKDVLQNKVKINQKAYKGSYDEGTTYQPFYLNSLIDKIGYDKSYKLDSFTILDMDGDKNPEIIIKIDGGDVEVLHYHNDKVYGYYFVNRAMESLKTDGTYIGSSGAMDNSINRISFSGSRLNEIILAYSESTGKYDKDGYHIINYFIAKKPVSETEFESYLDKQVAKADTTWYKINASNIEKHIIIK